jgi:hypothetical protein
VASGIRNLERVEAVDPDGRPAAVLIGHTEGGRVVLGIAPFGQDRGSFVFLNGDAQARFAKAFRTAIVGAAEASS